MTSLELAQEAFTQASDGRVDRGAKALTVNHFNRAKKYVDQAYEDLFNETKYDPRAYGIGLAEIAVIEWIKARLMNMMPRQSETYVVALTNWRKRAAVEYHREQIAEEAEEAEKA